MTPAPFETLWNHVTDPKEQMEMAVLYLVIDRDLDGTPPGPDALAELMATRHGWPRARTLDRLATLESLGLLDAEGNGQDPRAA